MPNVGPIKQRQPAVTPTRGYIKVVAKPCTLPDWHGGKGKPGLVLVDELFIN